jgi:hypothetical protein
MRAKIKILNMIVIWEMLVTLETIGTIDASL